jgi:hypothetical protein
MSVGQRPLDAFNGRWPTRDPIGFAGGSWNWYTYVNNQPSMRFDPNGLAGMSAPGCSGGAIDCTGTDSQICNAAYSSGMIDKNVLGTTICCPLPNGTVRKIACTFPGNWTGPGTTPPGVLACLQLHENCHLPDMSCGSNIGLGGPISVPGLNVGAYSECKCNWLNTECLGRSMRDECDGLPAYLYFRCLEAYMYQLAIEAQQTEINCDKMALPFRPPIVIKPMAVLSPQVRLQLQQSRSLFSRGQIVFGA